MTQAFNLSQFANKVNTSGQADLTTAVTGTLPIANGGTNNGSLAVTAGGVVYTDGTKLVNVGAGTSGQVLSSNGSSAPTWGSVSGTISWQSVQTSNFTATANNGYPINTTSAAVTITLPASPSIGNTIIIVDYAGTAATNNITVNPNGNKIKGSTSNGVISTNREGICLVYIDSTQGWLPYSDTVTNSIAQPYSVDFLVVAGGGGAGSPSGGGGAGGFRTSAGTSGGGGSAESAASVIPGTSYTVTIGAGGSGASYPNDGTQGNNSVFGSITSIGGGLGAHSGSGGNGGSGGGAGFVGSAGSGTANQGYSGGLGSATNPGYPGGGGGGAGAAGSNSSTTTGGNGGIGVSSSINGTATYYGGGGAGSSRNTGSNATGGTGGGGNGNISTSGSNGTANTGGGGGGGGYSSGTSGSGGSGIVIIRYAGSQRGTGGTVTSSGGNTIHTFTSSGTYVA